MQNKLKHIVLIAMAIFITACSITLTAPIQAATESKPGYTKATVVNVTLDGCTWMLQLEDNRNLEPANLADEFRKENLKVWIQYQPLKQAYSICMAGEIVSITAIELRK